MLRQVPVSIGLYMDPTFRDYVHQDRPAKGVAQDVSVGPASHSLFTEFLGAQFQSVAVLAAALTGMRPLLLRFARSTGYLDASEPLTAVPAHATGGFVCRTAGPRPTFS